MGQVSSDEKLAEHQRQTEHKKRHLITQIVLLEQQRNSDYLQATKAMNAGNHALAEMKSKNVKGADNTLRTLNSFLTNLNAQSQSLVLHQSGALMTSNAQSYIGVVQSINSEASMEQLQQTAKDYAAMQSEMDKRNNTISTMFTTHEDAVDVTDMMEQLKDAVALETMQSLPDVRSSALVSNQCSNMQPSVLRTIETTVSSKAQ